MTDFNIAPDPFGEPNDFLAVCANFYAIEVDKAVSRPWVVGRPRDGRQIAMMMLIAGSVGMLAGAASRTGIGTDKARQLAEEIGKLITNAVCDAAIAATEEINGALDRTNGRTIPRGPGGEPIAAINPDV